MRDFLEDEALGGADNILARYLKPELLIIDDMGLKQLPKHSGEHLFEIVLRRYENRSTIMTSNRPLEDWGKPIGDVPVATAILDRLPTTPRSWRSPDAATDSRTGPGRSQRRLAGKARKTLKEDQNNSPGPAGFEAPRDSDDAE